MNPSFDLDSIRVGPGSTGELLRRQIRFGRPVVIVSCAAALIQAAHGQFSTAIFITVLGGALLGLLFGYSRTLYLQVHATNCAWHYLGRRRTFDVADVTRAEFVDFGWTERYGSKPHLYVFDAQRQLLVHLNAALWTPDSVDRLARLLCVTPPRRRVGDLDGLGSIEWTRVSRREFRRDNAMRSTPASPLVTVMIALGLIVAGLLLAITLSSHAHTR